MGVSVLSFSRSLERSYPRSANSKKRGASTVVFNEPLKIFQCEVTESPLRPLRQEKVLRESPTTPIFAKGLDGSLLLAVPRGHETQIFKLLPDQPEPLSTLEVSAPVRFTSDSRYLFADQDDNLQIFDWQTQTPIDHPPILDYFNVSRDASVLLSHIYAPTGQLVRRLSPGIMPAGDYASQAKAVYWDGHNQIGETVNSGIYLYTIAADDFVATRKMLIRK